MYKIIIDSCGELTEDMKKECSIYLHDLTDYGEFCRWAFAECPTG